MVDKLLIGGDWTLAHWLPFSLDYLGKEGYLKTARHLRLSHDPDWGYEKSRSKCVCLECGWLGLACRERLGFDYLMCLDRNLIKHMIKLSLPGIVAE